MHMRCKHYEDYSVKKTHLHAYTKRAEHIHPFFTIHSGGRSITASSTSWRHPRLKYGQQAALITYFLQSVGLT